MPYNAEAIYKNRNIHRDHYSSKKSKKGLEGSSFSFIAPCWRDIE
jgi:hypothetical protein